ncbi:MAG: hypothetical protein E6845_07665 [Clostridium sp.]|uniref:hypothetical protein n=1 Tax=Clostridium sp. TaxID=1506 RepID=UPI0029007F16|nr:hypothetical protein [Clostridium sp.]MDU1602828.1 hypothetical protein [Clostridium sp.]
MAKKNNSVKVNVRKCSNGSVCEMIIKNEDESTKYNSLGFRVIYMFISLIILGNSLAVGKSFFISTFMFSFPLLYDYARYTTMQKWRIIFKRILLGIFGFEMAFSFFGMADILKIDQVNNKLFLEVSKTYAVGTGISIELWLCWAFLFSGFIMSTFEWMFASRKITEQMS